MANFIFKVENSGGMGDVLESAILIYSGSFFRGIIPEKYRYF